MSVRDSDSPSTSQILHCDSSEIALFFNFLLHFGYHSNVSNMKTRERWRQQFFATEISGSVTQTQWQIPAVSYKPRGGFTFRKPNSRSLLSKGKHYGSWTPDIYLVPIVTCWRHQTHTRFWRLSMEKKECQTFHNIYTDYMLELQYY